MASAAANLKRSILDYLVHHPSAKDTHEGVHNWWLAALPHHDVDDQAVIACLEELVALDWLARRPSTAGAIYSLNRNYLSEIRRFLEQDQEKT
jgi:hypothetical protein